MKKILLLSLFLALLISNSFADELLIDSYKYYYIKNNVKTEIDENFNNVDRSNVTKITWIGQVHTLNALNNYSDWGIKDINLSEATSFQDYWQFKNLKELETIEFPATIDFNLCSYAFYNCGIKSVIIPNNCKNIYSNAFGNCSSLASVTIYGDNDNNIYRQAFDNCNSIKTVEAIGDIKCETQSFPFEITICQSNETDALATNLCKLIYLEKNYSQYAGPRLKFISEQEAEGKSFQNILSMIQCGEFAKDKYNGYGGWLEFVNDGSSIIPKDKIRTYSDSLARTINDNVKAFIVNKISVDKSCAPNKISVGIKQIYNVIPANTGVILFSSEGSYLSLSDSKIKPYNQETDGEYKNYLSPQSFSSTVKLHCFETDENNIIIYRTFIFSKFSSTDIYDNSSDYYAFFKVKDGTYKYGYANLRLSADIINSKDITTLAIDETKEISFDLSDKSIQCKGIYFTDEETSKIEEISQTDNIDSWFTITGIKLLSKPTISGIYIHNSSKIIIR